MFGTKVLEERISKYNGKLKVVRTLGLGTYIQADGLTQSGGIVESMWSQTIKHIANGKRKSPTSCLILGLGGGTLVKILSKYFPEAKITGVDIDKEIVELGQKYLKSNYTNVNVEITDALKYVVGLSKKKINFDLLIVDLYNGDQFPKKFESEEFLKLIRTVLAKDAIVIFNRLYYKDKKLEAEKFGQKLRKIFINVDDYHPVTNLMFICVK